MRMEIIVGKNAGFCYGVKRAVDGAEAEAEKGKVFCLGELVHNKQVVNYLQEKGVVFIEKIEEAKGKTIIRAHGETKQTFEKAGNLGIQTVDFTCPFVEKIHIIGEKYKNDGYFIFLCGKKNHPENIATISYCGENARIIEEPENLEEAIEELKKLKIKKLLVIAQTTYSLAKFAEIENILKNELPKEIELVIKNTICNATEIRQKETEKLSKQVDAMIVIGGKNSSNTRKLYEICEKNCKNSICIETVEQLKIDVFKNENKIGIMAGASTPQKSIDEVVEKLKSIKSKSI